MSRRRENAGSGESQKRGLSTGLKWFLGAVIPTIITGVVLTTYEHGLQSSTAKKQRQADEAAAQAGQRSAESTALARQRAEMRNGISLTSYVVLPGANGEVCKFFDEHGNVFPNEWNSVLPGDPRQEFRVDQNAMWGTFQNALVREYGVENGGTGDLSDCAVWQFAVMTNGNQSDVKVESIKYSDGTVNRPDARLDRRSGLIFPVGIGRSEGEIQASVYPSVAYISYQGQTSPDTLAFEFGRPPDNGTAGNLVTSANHVPTVVLMCRMSPPPGGFGPAYQAQKAWKEGIKLKPITVGGFIKTLPVQRARVPIIRHPGVPVTGRRRE